MSCNAPISAWKSRTGGVTFHLDEAYTDLPVGLPCGKCFGCKLDRAKEWAIRCHHEAQMHDDSVFVTLTYNDRYLPKLNGTPTLQPSHFSDFMRSLRKKKARAKKCKCKGRRCIHGDFRIRYFMCGEYGSLGRPHYHALLFNCTFANPILHSRTADSILYCSPELEALWTKGFSTFGEVNYNSAAYVARYTLKKEPCTGPEFEINQLGQLRRRTYLRMSRKPGIGKEWLDTYLDEVYPTDEVITPSGYPVRPPRFYDKQLPESALRIITQARAPQAPDDGGEHNAAREAILKAKFALRTPEIP